MDISDREAFVAMRLFLLQFYARAGNDMETLIADITLESDGQPLDPAAWDDWTRCIELARRS
ncbi:hypothetical protein [Nitriliruptor alkaliphilus]|uniref:hypothetical protein n=1 Tax=Nitriliruptor alkaliphilus TaxID=427918 RepID=UPI000697A79E|nr:hypothetical protein [Nitriliruptor alkaliphilus]